jgi:hypothetical protein
MKTAEYYTVKAEKGFIQVDKPLTIQTLLSGWNSVFCSM